MNKKELYKKVSNIIVDSCMADSYRLEYDGIDFEYKEIDHIYRDMNEVVRKDFSILSISEKKALENKNLKVLLANLSHPLFGNVDWNTQAIEETARLLYGIKFWILKNGGPYVVDVVIKNNLHVEIVFLIVQLFDKYM